MPQSCFSLSKNSIGFFGKGNALRLRLAKLCEAYSPTLSQSIPVHSARVSLLSEVW